MKKIVHTKVFTNNDQFTKWQAENPAVVIHSIKPVVSDVTTQIHESTNIMIQKEDIEHRLFVVYTIDEKIAGMQSLDSIIVNGFEDGDMYSTVAFHMNTDYKTAREFCRYIIAEFMPKA